jgi:hypothetical protein
MLFYLTYVVRDVGLWFELRSFTLESLILAVFVLVYSQTLKFFCGALMAKTRRWPTGPLQTGTDLDSATAIS